MTIRTHETRIVCTKHGLKIAVKPDDYAITTLQSGRVILRYTGVEVVLREYMGDFYLQVTLLDPDELQACIDAMKD